MKTIVCISCVKSKRPEPSRADELYTSPLFKKMLAYAESLRPDRICILSAEHGLLERSQIIAPYEKTLNKMRKHDRDIWYAKVIEQLKATADLDTDTFVFLAGERYREGLLPYIKHYSVPMEGLGLGQQMAWLTCRYR